jgi:hypothetical protein
MKCDYNVTFSVLIVIWNFGLKVKLYKCLGNVYEFVTPVSEQNWEEIRMSHFFNLLIYFKSIFHIYVGPTSVNYWWTSGVYTF